MKKEIVYTDKYAIILSDEFIKKFYDWNNFEISDFSESMDVILAHLPLSDAPILEGVPLLPSFSWSQQDDVEKLAKEEYPIFDGDLLGIANNQQHSRIDFIKGYNKAKEKYKYTEEDVIKMVEKSRETGLTAEYLMLSLQQPSRPTHFECEMVQLSSNESFGLDYGSSNLKPKTTTNSQGYTELVGKYI